MALLPDWRTLHLLAIHFSVRSFGAISYRELMDEWTIVDLLELDQILPKGQIDENL